MGRKVERKDWRPEQPPVLMGLELYYFIRDTIGEVEATASYNVDIDHSCVALQCDYGFTHLTFAAKDEKVSGIKYNVLQSLIWQDIVGNNISENPESILERLNYAYRRRCMSHLIPSDDFIRKSKGTFVSLGKLVAALYPSMNTDTVSQAASKLADALRLRACPDTSAIAVSDCPSQIYTLPHASRGRVGHSCMANKSTAMFKLYDIIEDCSIVYIKEDNMLIGRALIWRNVVNRKTNNSYTIMDRVYSDCAQTEAIFFQYARKNDMIYKEKKSVNCNNWIDRNNYVLENPDLVVNCGDLKNAGLEKLPYLDSFYNYHHYDKLLSVDCTDNYEGCENTDGADTYLRNTDGSDDNDFIC